MDTLVKIGSWWPLLVFAALYLINRRLDTQSERAKNASDYIYREFDNLWRELRKREKRDAEKT